jgi:hypothetical protein
MAVPAHPRTMATPRRRSSKRPRRQRAPKEPEPEADTGPRIIRATPITEPLHVRSEEYGMFRRARA